jgi:cystathionine gamma-synthase
MRDKQISLICEEIFLFAWTEEEQILHILTALAQAGNRLDPTGAISFPVYQSSTFAHPGLGESTGFDYSRSSNPTRHALESAFAQLEGGCRGFAFSSGMAAITTALSLFEVGDHLIVTEDLYGGTYRILKQIFNKFGLEVTFVDTSQVSLVKESIQTNTKAIFVETLTNPLMRVANILELNNMAKESGLMTIIDNTFLTPYLQRPLDLGADIVVHSATKYLGGHNDVTAGLVAIRDTSLAERFGVLQNALGAVLGPQDSWLLLRGLKTLGLRLREQEKNALALARWLREHPLIEHVYYPGLEDHPGHNLQAAQAKGFGAMLSFTLRDKALVSQVLGKVKVISFAESLGGVESLITYPATQTHADIPEDIRLRLGVNDRLLRLSVGIEYIEDLISDLAQALEVQI